MPEQKKLTYGQLLLVIYPPKVTSP